jgi:hypothetical protein
VTNIVSSLNEGRVRFTYTKADGSTRQATGTTNPSLIPGDTPAPSNTETGESVTYYDLDRNDWRQFRRSALDTSSVQKVDAA